MSSRAVRALRERLFGDVASDWQRYHALVARHLRAGMTVVEVGPGKGTIVPFPWAEHGEIELIGLDPDPAAAANPFLHRFEQLRDGEPWPLESGSADLVMARYVLEHVKDPGHFMANVARILRPGGVFVFLTPNRRHPIMMVSRLLPYGLHRIALARTRRLDAGDVFPTFYRLNSPMAIADQAREHGLSIAHLAVNEFVPTGYLDFCLPGFLAALLYHQVVTATGLERVFGLSMTGVLEKRATASESAGRRSAAPADFR